MDLAVVSTSQLYKYFGLSDNTIHFIGHALALH